MLVLTRKQLQAVIENRPEGFGEQPGTYHSDAIFLMGIDAAQAMPVFNPREGVDKIWPGDGVIYSQRLSSLRTKSRLSTIIGTPAYQSMTIRSWNTTTQVRKLLEEQTHVKRSHWCMNRTHINPCERSKRGFLLLILVAHEKSSEDYAEKLKIASSFKIRHQDLFEVESLVYCKKQILPLFW